VFGVCAHRAEGFTGRAPRAGGAGRDGRGVVPIGRGRERRRSQIKLSPGPPRGRMRPAVKRRLATLAAAVSLLLCVLTVALRMWSYDSSTRLRRNAIARLMNGAAQVETMDVWELEGSAGGLKIKHLSIEFTPWRTANVAAGWQIDRTVGFSTYPIESSRSEFRYIPFFAGFQVAIGDWVWTAKTNGVTSKYRHRSFTIPLWCPTLLFAILPALGLTKWISRRRFPVDRCQECGYDLRATPDRCPECGAVAAPARYDASRREAPPA